ncbi:c6 zinc finger domain-containing protein [Xylaria grammica]|nr:c6 zinc finger domain-containing protein [Xylaria grammica]
MDSSTQPQQRGQFQCASCQRIFTRADHLTRHVRSHLQERPFQCQTCGKGFGRSDLLKRHVAGHEAENGAKRQRIHAPLPRVHQACRPCAAAKLKCDDEKPCSRCLQRGITCQEGVRDGDEAPVNPSSQSIDGAGSPAKASVTGRVSMLTNRELDTSPMTSDAYQRNTEPLTPFASTDNETPLLPGFQHPVIPSFSEYDMSLFLKGVISLPPESSQHLVTSEDWSQSGLDSDARGLLDFTIDESFDFEDADMNELDPYPSMSCDNSNQQPEFTLPHDFNLPEEGNPRGHVALGIDAYRKSSLGPWEPSQSDHTASELEGLAALGPGADAVEKVVSPHSPWFGEYLKQSTRDSTLAMILETCRPERKSNVIKAFPTCEMFDFMLQKFFSDHRRRPDSFIHCSTFNPNSQQPELLGITIAIGAILTDRRSLQKLGFAMQEVVRTRMPGRFESAHSTSRELWALQTYICEMETGLWSGIKRKMEIAESCISILYTMLRRSSGFGAREGRFSPPLSLDTEEVLHQKWLQWVGQESHRRLVYHSFILDAQCSMAMRTSPSISFAELATPFPEKHDLWLADAERWKALYLSRAYPDTPASLVEYLRSPSEIPECYDIHFCHLAILCGVWGMIWQYSQLKVTLNQARHLQTTSDMQQQGLLQMLQRFRIYITESREPLRPETALVLELLHMYLHVSFEDIELFAGKKDLEDARRVFPSLQQWFDTQEARQAIWHSGQVIRAARDFGRKQLRGFYAIAVYQASLVLWAYSVISLAKERQKQTPVQSQAAALEAVCLDGPESPAVQRFIALGKGVPGLSSSRKEGGQIVACIPLSEQEQAMRAILETLDGNFPCRRDSDAAPPLVENLAQLLHELGRAASSVQ